MEAALHIDDLEVKSQQPEYSLRESLAYALKSEGSGVREHLTRDMARAHDLTEADASALADAVTPESRSGFSRACAAL